MWLHVHHASLGPPSPSSSPPLPVARQILVAILLRYKRRPVELNCVIYFDRKVKIIKIVLQPKFANVTKVYVCLEVRKYICVSYSYSNLVNNGHGYRYDVSVGSWRHFATV